MIEAAVITAATAASKAVTETLNGLPDMGSVSLPLSIKCHSCLGYGYTLILPAFSERNRVTPSKQPCNHCSSSGVPPIPVFEVANW